MEHFPEKVRLARRELLLSQEQLGKKIGVSRRTVCAYESGTAVPRKKMLRKLAGALEVSAEYLTDDSVTDKDYGKPKESLLGNVRTLFGEKGAKEAEELMQRNVAFLAGGSVDQEAKDAFFEALMTAYITCKKEAQKKFGAAKDAEADV